MALQPVGGLAILSIGGPLDPGTHCELVMRSCGVSVVADLGAALRELDATQFDVVVVRPTIEVEGDGVRFVRGLKSSTTSSWDDQVADLPRAYALAPFIILPLRGTREFAVFRDAQRWYLGDTTEIPLFRAILGAKFSDVDG